MIKTLLFVAGTCLAWFVSGSALANGEYLLSATSSILAVSLLVWSRGKFLSRFHTHFNYAFFNLILVSQVVRGVCSITDIICLVLLLTAWYCHWKIPSKLTEAR